MTERVRILAGRYQVGDLLGRGGMADVYEGSDSRLGRKVAIKLLKPTLANDPAFRSRFRQEAQSASRMAHPTIVRVYDAGEETIRDDSGVEVQVPFIVMEYVEGRLLSDMIADGPLAPERAVKIMDGVLTALEYSHRAGVVHRDIKPGNIMVTAAGQVKVMDFGIARAISDSAATIAQTSAILGTAQYFSPEQARGESVDARTDLYSAGIVLYEMLTGRPPFSGGTAVAVAYQHLSEAPVPPATLVPAVSPALNAVVLRALAKDRFERFQSAVDFREDVDVAVEGKVPDRAPGGRDDDFSTTLFGVNPSASAGSAATLRRLSADEDDRVPRTQSRPPVAWIWAGISLMAIVVVVTLVWVFNLTPPSLNSGNVAIRVPDVAGMTFEQAEAELTKTNLRAVQVQVVDEEVPAGQVIKSQPGPDVVVPPQQQITLTVSSGTEMVRIPDVSYKSAKKAAAALKKAGLAVGETRKENSPNVPEGVAIGTEPAAGASEVHKGQEVTLIVSTGRISIPDVTGKSIDEAQTTLSGAQYQLTVKVIADRGCGGRAVSAQSLKGEQAQKSAVELTYCAG
ncbi:Stk1 family PASTA domain-containing Ser/Thr kinase [Homoserinibacter sp. YIM 151385]|uniref:Stk1 family PASTA domain-containing Ser/Thr kinase n=1 Tax=Homoserinibacter sp. YIM 151385 TaxID=2985506 RepID=UPI0022F124BB|nr:Stk1 family PASTA domain-containing Ser/Thr kinase [Homoserinibacter sp. YIM 151385]WBU37223.1 Stk1 family PASTA domain-containing Ser/Thr kinase [Homoserinibacter sp. YIM 151385]